jgi:hypothetical protein
LLRPLVLILHDGVVRSPKRRINWQPRRCQSRTIWRYYHHVDHGLLGCDAVWSCRCLPKFLRNVLPPSSGKRTLVTIKTTKYHNPEEYDQHFHCRENLKSQILSSYSHTENE